MTCGWVLNRVISLPPSRNLMKLFFTLLIPLMRGNMLAFRGPPYIVNAKVCEGLEGSRQEAMGRMMNDVQLLARDGRWYILEAMGVSKAIFFSEDPAVRALGGLREAMLIKEIWDMCRRILQGLRSEYEVTPYEPFSAQAVEAWKSFYAFARKQMSQEGGLMAGKSLSVCRNLDQAAQDVANIVILMRQFGSPNPNVSMASGRYRNYDEILNLFKRNCGLLSIAA
jgi:hypothetical protein